MSASITGGRMKPIIFDTETTGTDHQTDQIIEAA